MSTDALLQDYLVLSRGRWDSDKSPEEIQQAIDAFYDWHGRLVREGKAKSGQRLGTRGKVVTRGGLIDGPFAEAKEIVGGYWFFRAGSLEEAVELAAQNPCLACGLTYEVRPVEAARASAYAVTNETPPGRDPVTVEHVAAPTDEARALIAELDADLAVHYAAEQQHGLSVERVFRPGVRFFVARLDGQPAGCGGIAFEDGFGELKRMYVRPDARGRGVAQAILARLEEEARSRGVSRLVLETGDVQHAALRFYEREGFTRCGAFGAYATMPPVAVERSVFFEKRIG